MEVCGQASCMFMQSPLPSFSRMNLYRGGGTQKCLCFVAAPKICPHPKTYSSPQNLVCACVCTRVVLLSFPSLSWVCAHTSFCRKGTYLRNVRPLTYGASCPSTHSFTRGLPRTHVCNFHFFWVFKQWGGTGRNLEPKCVPQFTFFLIFWGEKDGGGYHPTPQSLYLPLLFFLCLSSLSLLFFLSLTFSPYICTHTH